VLSKISCELSLLLSIDGTDRQTKPQPWAVIRDGDFRGERRAADARGDKCPGTGGGVRLETEGGEKWKRGGGQLLCFRSFVVV